MTDRKRKVFDSTSGSKSLSQELKRLSSPVKHVSKKRKDEIDDLAEMFAMQVTFEDIVDNNKLEVTVKTKKGRKTTEKKMDLTDLLEKMTVVAPKKERKIIRPVANQNVRRSGRLHTENKLPTLQFSKLKMNDSMNAFIARLLQFTTYLHDNKYTLKFLEETLDKVLEARQENDVKKMKRLLSTIQDVHRDVKDFVLANIEDTREVISDLDTFVPHFEKYLDKYKDTEAMHPKRKANVDSIRNLYTVYISEFKELQKTAESIVKKVSKLSKRSAKSNDEVEDELAQILANLNM